MSRIMQRKILSEVEIIQRFAQSYGGKFEAMIDRMNHAPAGAAEVQCLRLCVEAVNMVVAVQGRLAKVLAEMSAD